jgi:type I restriction enzyme S subunit
MTYVDAQTHREIYARCPVEFEDVLYIKDGVTTGIAALNTLHEPFSMLSSVALLKPRREVLNPRYLKHWLNSPVAFASMTAGMTGTAIKRLVLRQIRATEMRIAPLKEQQRIADKLDTVLARVDACRDRLARVAPLLKRFRQSVLVAAMSGRLTSDIEPAFDSRLESLARLGAVSGGLTKNARRDKLPMRRPYLRVANVRANELRLDDVTDIGLTDAEFSKTKLVSGDLLIVEGNGSIEQIGRVAMWSGEVANCCHQNHLIRWRAGAHVLPKFVLFFLLSPEGRRQIEAVASSTTGLHTLSVSKVGELQLPVPELELQAEIVRRVETLFAFADRLEARLARAQTAVDRLTPSLLAKAFRGELVPQDPADEPAAELLKRLQASAAAGPAPGRARRRAPSHP